MQRKYLDICQCYFGHMSVLFFRIYESIKQLFIEVLAPSQKSERSLLEVSICPHSTIFLFDFGTVLTV